MHGMVRRKGEQGTLSGTASDFWPLEVSMVQGSDGGLEN